MEHIKNVLRFSNSLYNSKSTVGINMNSIKYLKPPDHFWRKNIHFLYPVYYTDVKERSKLEILNLIWKQFIFTWCIQICVKILCVPFKKYNFEKYSVAIHGIELYRKNKQRHYHVWLNPSLCELVELTLNLKVHS